MTKSHKVVYIGRGFDWKKPGGNAPKQTANKPKG